MTRPLRCDGLSVQLPGQSDGELADVDHLLHLTERLGGDLARLDRDERAEIGLVLDEEFTEPRHQSAPHRRGRHAPHGERPGGVGDGRVGLLGGGFGDAEQHVTSDRGARGHTWCSGLAELDMRPDRMQRGLYPVAQLVGGGQGGGLHAGQDAAFS